MKCKLIEGSNRLFIEVEFNDKEKFTIEGPFPRTDPEGARLFKKLFKALQTGQDICEHKSIGNSRSEFGDVQKFCQACGEII